jgi:very-short-patch-repair endonuclease
MDRAKSMRTQATPAEAKLWSNLRGKRLAGTKFSRQVVIGPFIADFVARSRKLVIEVDGDSHGTQIEYDARRTAFLEREGYRVLRFTNSDVRDRLEGVLSSILDVLMASPLPDPLPGGEREMRS